MMTPSHNASSDIQYLHTGLRMNCGRLETSVNSYCTIRTLFSKCCQSPAAKCERVNFPMSLRAAASTKFHKRSDSLRIFYAWVKDVHVSSVTEDAAPVGLPINAFAVATPLEKPGRHFRSRRDIGVSTTEFLIGALCFNILMRMCLIIQFDPALQMAMSQHP